MDRNVDAQDLDKEIKPQIDDMQKSIGHPGFQMTLSALKSFFKEILVKEINKRELGKLQIQLVGNEGADIDTATEKRRKLIQACIDFLRQKPHHVWKNAEMSIYDTGFNGIIMRSGHGKHAYLCIMNEKNEPEISDVSQKRCIIM